MKIIQIEYMSDEDITLTEAILVCGTNKTKYKADIIYLFKKYIDSSVHICNNCSLEIVMLLSKYILYYNNYIERQNGK